MNEEIKEKLAHALNEIITIRKECYGKQLLNTQEYIEFENALNEISVKDPNHE